MAKLAVLELRVASLPPLEDLVCSHLEQRLGNLQGAGALPTDPRLQWNGRKAFLSNARQEEVNETNTISAATP